MKLNSTRGKGPLVAWACVMAVAVVWTVSASTNQVWLRSNVFELLPESEYDVLTETAARAVENELATQFLFLIGHADSDIALASADRFGATLREHRLVDSVTARIEDDQYASIAGFYFPYRRQILSDDQLADISVDNGAAIERNALATIYSPLGAGRAAGLATDPFFLFPDSLGEVLPSDASLELRQGHLWVEREGKQYVFIRARLNAPTLSIAEQESLGAQLAMATEDLLSSEPEVDILKTGFFFFAHAATQSAKNEISVIGLGSLIGLVMLVFVTFRSVRPLSLIALSISSGCLIALAVTLWVFGFVHLFTLVFGASLIGVSVDYSFHYVADDAFGGVDWSPEIGLRRIFSGITLGLLTSMLAYLALTIAPFPGLRQLAVFSSAGLIGAYLTLICCCRFWRRRLFVPDTSLIFRAASWYLGAWRALQFKHRALLVGMLAIVALGGLGRLEINDDIAALQAQPAELQRQEAVIQEALGVASGGSFLLVSSSSEENLLQLEESIRVMLDGMIAADELGSYQAVSRWVPSETRQAQSVAAYGDLLDARLSGYFQTLGVPQETLEAARADLSRSVEPLGVNDWLAHAVSAESGALWLDTADNTNASVIVLFGVENVAGLRSRLDDYPSI